MNIIQIESKENKKIKELNKLKLKKYRVLREEFIVENWKIIQDGFDSGIYFKELFLTKDFLDRYKDVLEKMLDNKGVFLVSESIGKILSTLESPQGIVAVYDKPKGHLDFNQDIVYLNGINDPGNMGTILRSALAFGLKNIVLDEKCVDLYNAKTIQAAKDAIFKLEIVFDKDGKIFKKIKENNFNLLVTAVEEGENIEKVLSTKAKKCIVLGSESQGVDISIKKEAASLINIKTTSSIESLNVAISAGIIFYEMVKGLKEGDVDHNK